MKSGKQYWLMDEVCAILDQDTAKIVAFNKQKPKSKLLQSTFLQKLLSALTS
ncbi:MAG: hypothetical protein ACETVQ_04140 [Candidatus Bathyarchaeia archaeon]